VATVATFAAPALAAAQLAPGVHVDPGSPAGKEYAVPLAQARAAAAGGGAGPTQLFGAGITRPDAGVPNSKLSGSAAGAGAAAQAELPAHRAAASGSTKARLASATIPPPSKVLGSGQGDPVAWMLAAAALVLVAGGVAGTVMVRRR
jgi:hypothetical protein